MTYRNRKLLDLAHECPCCAEFKHPCSAYNGVVPAHSDSSIWGRGHGHKSHDFAFAAMCQNAHIMLDDFNREQKYAEWTRAHVGTMAYLWQHEKVRVA